MKEFDYCTSVYQLEHFGFNDSRNFQISLRYISQFEGLNVNRITVRLRLVVAYINIFKVTVKACTEKKYILPIPRKPSYTHTQSVQCLHIKCVAQRLENMITDAISVVIFRGKL